MTKIAMSRRHMLGAGACALAGAMALPAAASPLPPTALSAATEHVVRKWYASWEQPDWAPVDALLAANFTFSSAAGDDHISKSVFKTRCWETQINFIGRMELERVVTSGSDAFVKYLCVTKNGKSLRNVEYLRVSNGKVESIECYFGQQSSFPSAVAAG